MINRRVHLLSTPNVQATAAYYLDVFSGFTRRFAELLTEMGWTVFLYGSEEADCPCIELINCISKENQAKFLGEDAYNKGVGAWYDAANPMWVYFNNMACAAIQERKRPGDLIASIAGTAQLPIWQQHQELPFLEYSIGYKGVCAPYRIFQSHAWRHVLHGITGCAYGREMDDVIYHWYHEDEFPERPASPYLLFVGRLTSNKGLRTVCEAAKQSGRQLFVIGDGDPSLVTYGEYIGHMPPKERNRWMAAAEAVLTPTEYIEPSACVVTESQLCGTPVIASNWGGFTEYIEDKQTGFLCKNVGEFVAAIGRARDLDRGYIRARARTLYGWDAGKVAYTAYFQRLEQHVSAPQPLSVS